MLSGHSHSPACSNPNAELQIPISHVLQYCTHAAVLQSRQLQSGERPQLAISHLYSSQQMFGELFM